MQHGSDQRSGKLLKQLSWALSSRTSANHKVTAGISTTALMLTTELSIDTYDWSRKTGID